MVIMRETGLMVKELDMENISGLQVIKRAIYITVTGEIIKKMEKVQPLFQMATNISESGGMIK